MKNLKANQGPLENNKAKIQLKHERKTTINNLKYNLMQMILKMILIVGKNSRQATF